LSRPRTATTRRQWLALAAATGMCTAHADAPKPQPWSRQKPQPTLAFSTLDDGAWKLSEQTGQTVLLNFWASWCEPCRAEIPALQRLAARYAQSGLQVRAVNFRESLQSVRRFTADAGMTLPVLMDADGSAAQSLGISIFPTTVVIDRRGRIRFTVTGECAWDQEPATGWLRAVLQSA